MIFYDFKNYEEFKELFGIVEHANGTKSRKNKILLAMYKDKDSLRRHIKAKENESICESLSNANRRNDNTCDSPHYRRWRIICNKWCDRYRCRNFYDTLACDNMQALKSTLYDILQDDSLRVDGSYYSLELNRRVFRSPLYRTDHMKGLCEDNTLNAIRYVNTENGRVFKMKAGKMLNHIIENNILVRAMPEQVKRWFSEEFVADWVEYARENLCDCPYTLHVDDNFKRIYSQSCLRGDFHSCMVNRHTWTFYRDAVQAKAAYLTDGDDKVVARCIIYTDVKDGEGKHWRLAERQYSTNCDSTLKRQLVNALIKGGHIDGYKIVGAGCSDEHAFVDNLGNSLSNLNLSIVCNLESGDTVSYQDSFKSYDYDSGRAYNYGYGDDIDLSTTDGEVNFGDEDYVWSGYHQEDIPQDEAVYVETRDSYFYYNECVEARVWSQYHNRFYTERCYSDDVIEIGHEYYFAGENGEYPLDWGLSFCEQCEEYYPSEDGVYSDVTEEYYCSEYCRDEAERDWYEENGYEWSDFEDKWIKPEDVLHVRNWHSFYHCYVDSICSVDFFNNLAERGKATEYMGEFYIDKVMYDGEPAHLGCERKIA